MEINLKELTDKEFIEVLRNHLSGGLVHHEKICDEAANRLEKYLLKKDLCVTADDFGVSDEDFLIIARKLEELGYADDKKYALDYHTEPSEEAMFDWINDDKYMRPIDIKKSPMPSERENVLNLNGTWYFWYV